MSLGLTYLSCACYAQNEFRLGVCVVRTVHPGQITELLGRSGFWFVRVPLGDFEPSAGLAFQEGELRRRGREVTVRIAESGVSEG